MVFAIQRTCFASAAAIMANVEADENPFDIPANVESAVRITQILALLRAVATQEDVREAFCLLINGYSQRKYHEIAGEVTYFQVGSQYRVWVGGALGLL